MKLRRRRLAIARGLGFAFALGAGLAAGAAAVDAVRVEIVEGIPDETSWDFKPPAASESYAEPAFGFVALPTRYNERGVKTDRGKPFLFRATASVTLPAGEQRLLLRARSGSRLMIDGREILATRFPDLRGDGHEEVPEVPRILSPGLRYLRPGHFESLTNYVADGQPHVFTLEALIALKDRRPELGEMIVAAACTCDSPEIFHLLSPSPTIRVPLDEDAFDAFAGERRRHWRDHDAIARRELSAKEDEYWKWRHELARKAVETAPRGDSRAAADSAAAGEPVGKGAGESKPTAPSPPPAFSPASVPSGDGHSIDGLINAKLAKAGVKPAPLTDDYSFLRRVSLDVVGTIPTAEVAERFGRDARPDKRARLIDELLAQDGWADHWISYWQDVLAENPGIVKPMLNNTGPFRWWLSEAFRDNRPMDRLVTELILMEGSVYFGGPAGFGMATDNDVPLAQKAQIIAQAFLGMQMQCARCHDAPHHNFKQRDLFSLAAMLKRGPQEIPWSSSIPTNAHVTVGRKVKVTLPPGSKVDPAWPFASLISEADLPPGVLRRDNDSRERLAAVVTDPRNPRFARVLVNRVWKRYLGWGLVEPVDDWETAQPSHPELLDFLATELVAHDYDLKQVARLILQSQTYQRAVRSDGSEDKPGTERLFASPARRRLSAEQLVDSLFLAVGKPVDSEEMNMDVDGRRPVKEFNNLGTPVRAWEFTSLSNERDRPALALPRAQAVVDTLIMFGWRESRQGALTVRDDAPNALQPASLAHGVLSHGRIARLSDDSELTSLALADRPLPEFVRALTLRLLSRPPAPEEAASFIALLESGYAERRNGIRSAPSESQTGPDAGGGLVLDHADADAVRALHKLPARAVSWANHLNPEATRIKQEQERAVRLGDPPTSRLDPDWRERVEDLVWALINSPEFVFVP